jgi:site-specific DNA-methyltransferase (adenine-specific)
MNKVLIGDCFELIKDIPDNSVDLVITSPPYSSIVSYGKDVSIYKADEYVSWILPLFKEIHRVLKSSGSFILNINDNCDGGYRNTFIYELIYRNSKETPLKLYDTYVWHKKNGIPNGSKKRFRNNTEFIFHFCKNQKDLKFYMDRVLQDPKESYSKRVDGVIQFQQSEIVDGKRPIVKIRKTNKQVDEFVEPIIPDKVRPDNVFRFLTAGQSRDNTIRHPAPYHKELPTYFINLLTDEGDTILDVFGGIMTTGVACNEIGNRTFIGFELNEKYAEFGIKRINDNSKKYENIY